MIQIRKLKVDDDSSITVLFFTAFGTVVKSVSLVFAWRTPTLKDLLIMALLALFATTGQLLFTVAVRRESAAKLAPTPIQASFGQRYLDFSCGAKR